MSNTLSRIEAPRCGRQRGVSLLEVLIAVLVLSFGLLGLAGLQMNALRSNQSSYERSAIVIHTYSIVEAMRADVIRAENGGFNIGIDDAAPNGTTFAERQLADWRTRLTAALGPSASGSVACNGRDCTITVRWDDTRGSGGVANQTIVTEVRL